MCDYNGCQMIFSCNLLDLVFDGFFDHAIQSTQRLVKKQDLRLHYHGSRKSHSLFLSAGKLFDLLIQMVLQSQKIDQSIDFLHRCNVFVIAKAVCNILFHIQIREERIILEYNIESSLFHWYI